MWIHCILHKPIFNYYHLKFDQRFLTEMDILEGKYKALLNSIAFCDFTDSFFE